MTIYSPHPAQCDLDWFAANIPQNFRIRLASEQETLHIRTTLSVHPAVRSKCYVLSKRGGASFLLMHSGDLSGLSQRSCQQFHNELCEDHWHREAAQQRPRTTPQKGVA
jgi:hypothetical protein